MRRRVVLRTVSRAGAAVNVVVAQVVRSGKVGQDTGAVLVVERCEAQRQLQRPRERRVGRARARILQWRRRPGSCCVAVRRHDAAAVAAGGGLRARFRDEQ
jgi:hypothetical protein